MSADLKKIELNSLKRKKEALAQQLKSIEMDIVRFSGRGETT